ncbi:hypothetical protein, partial [Serratia proteamaculans]|uniref:hypothetical protein n=1 Tax=Serratia proteamaculans TaxID=28151 RepID=UPI0021BD0AD2
PEENESNSSRVIQRGWVSFTLAGWVRIQSVLTAKCSVPPSLCIIGANEGLPPLNDLEVSILRKSGENGSATDCLYNFLYSSLTGYR